MVASQVQRMKDTEARHAKLIDDLQKSHKAFVDDLN
jgi:hypothetical protein